MQHEPTFLQLVVPALLVVFGFGFWQRSFLAGMFMAGLIIFWSNHQ